MARDEARAAEREAVTCFGCRHFRVRHDPRWPYGCEHFALRSRALPALEVRRASGDDCRAREPRDVVR